MLISFLGSLPLGTVNVTATNISIKSGTTAATFFSAGCWVIETICLCIVLIAMEWVRRKQKIFRTFKWLTALLILALAAGSFEAAYQMRSFGNNVFTEYNIHPLLLGLLLSTLNPLHIPFWFGWSTVLMNKNILIPGKKNYFVYVAGISIGTFAGFDVFIYGGNYLVQKLHDNQNIINWVIGVILLLTALIQFYKMLYRPVVLKAI